MKNSSKLSSASENNWIYYYKYKNNQTYISCNIISIIIWVRLVVNKISDKKRENPEVKQQLPESPLILILPVLHPSQNIISVEYGAQNYTEYCHESCVNVAPPAID